ncbi:hypothetical protein [Amycolatopsis sp. NPDC051903]|uniref:hypothetical protein n=1 Tax=Amycolatopsis sp. NPDC051903 TaxID=3363936 RepID=UPI0037B4369F
MTFERLERLRSRLRPMLLARMAEIDGPPRPGRCDPRCGFLQQGQPATDLSAHRPEPVPIACTVTGSAQAERGVQWRELLAGAEREAFDGRLEFRLAAESAGRVAAAKQDCCAFCTFTLRFAGGGLEFEVRAPAEAAPLLADVFSTAR